MTVKELITKLLDRPMDDEVMLCYDKVHTDEFGTVIQGYGFHIDSVRDSDIMFTDWRDKAEVEPQESEDIGDYPGIIRNQFDNMTGTMNL